MIKSSYIESIVGLFRFYNTKKVLNSQRNPVILMTRFLINIKKSNVVVLYRMKYRNKKAITL